MSRPSDPAVRARWLRRLGAALGLAGLVGSTLAAAQARSTLEARVQAVREALLAQAEAPAAAEAGPPGDVGAQAQWQNWPNWGNWQNWSNWNNWPNWSNWGNWFNR